MLGILGELLVAPHDQRVVAADRRVQAVPVAADPRPDLPVVEPRRHAHVELDRAAHALDHPEDLAPLGLGRAFVDREAVEQLGLAGRSEQGGLEHQRVIEVGANVIPGPVANRADRAVTAV